MKPIVPDHAAARIEICQRAGHRQPIPWPTLRRFVCGFCGHTFAEWGRSLPAACTNRREDTKDRVPTAFARLGHLLDCIGMEARIGRRQYQAIHEHELVDLDRVARLAAASHNAALSSAVAELARDEVVEASCVSTSFVEIDRLDTLAARLFGRIKRKTASGVASAGGLVDTPHDQMERQDEGDYRGKTAAART